MRFTSVAAGAVAIFASVHGATAAETTASPTYSLTPAESSAASCLSDCKADDVNCRAHCIAVPSPDDDNANRTTACVAKCPQGDGTEAETAKYASCIDKCINDNFYVTATGTPSSPTSPADSSSSDDDKDGSADSTGSGSDSDAADSTATMTTGGSTSAATETDSSSATETPAAAPGLVASSFTVFGVIAAVLAL